VHRDSGPCATGHVSPVRRSTPRCGGPLSFAKGMSGLALAASRRVSPARSRCLIRPGRYSSSGIAERPAAIGPIALSNCSRTRVRPLIMSGSVSPAKAWSHRSMHSRITLAAFSKLTGLLIPRLRSGPPLRPAQAPFARACRETTGLALPLPARGIALRVVENVRQIPPWELN